MIPAQVAPKDLTATEIARAKHVHPSAVVRWMLKGAPLSDGNRLFLRFYKLPGEYRIKPEWLEEFIERLTADRQQPETTAEAKPGPKRQRIATMNASLTEAGF